MSLAAYIREDLKFRIHCEDGLPCRLTLLGLAEHYRVSVTPVRTAVFDYAAPEAHVVAEMASQHRQILDALIARHWAKARQALSDYIRAQRPILNSLLDTVPSGD